ncbi:hypothetical protein [Paenibacillus macquariensis]|uniref:Uncharacterized protein n=1 Tax=Paenibacillus macquariensis TaxID=948756 RepID=A0ABY1JW39_9BACL|nr:hypothetical protein [Paenibacillus macquariensis]MEC0090653.1 hypothetical protein [Paenibacillus macquariensis]SIQ87110.1 hypothetical protein SAMN05421578_104423 [Paenibacillus macquariensis]
MATALKFHAEILIETENLSYEGVKLPNRGTRLEPLVAYKFACEHPERAITEKKVIYCHSEHRWALSNFDRVLFHSMTLLWMSYKYPSPTSAP